MTALARLEQALDQMGSTRQLGLMRIALAWLLWSTWGYGFVFHFDLHPDRIVLGASFFLAAWLLFIGLVSRFAAAWAALTLLIASVHLGEGGAWTIWSEQHRQLTLMLTALFALSPCGGSFSVDRWLALRRAERSEGVAPEERGPLWTIALLRAFTGAVFVLTTLALANTDWLSGVPVARAMFGGSRAVAEAPVWAVFASWVLLCAHAFVTVGIWLARWRTIAVATGAVTYLLLYVTLPLGTLPLVVCWLLFAFIPAPSVHRAIDRMHGRGG